MGAVVVMIVNEMMMMGATHLVVVMIVNEMMMM